MQSTGATSQQFENSLKYFAKFLVDLHKLPTLNSVSNAEEKAHDQLEVGFEEMGTKEMQILMLMQQMVEIYSRDRQLQITGRNSYANIVELDEAATNNGYCF